MIRVEYWIIFALFLLSTVIPSILIVRLSRALSHRLDLMIRRVDDSMTETDSISEEHGKDDHP